MASRVLRLLPHGVAGLEAPGVDPSHAKLMLAAAVEFGTTPVDAWQQMTRKQQSKLLELLRQVAERAKRLNEQLTDAEVAAGSLVLRNQVTAASMVVATGFHATHELQCEAAEALRLCDALALILRAGPSCAEAAAPAGDTSSLQVQLNAVAQAADQLQQNSEAGAAFVRTVVRPEALLPWLAAAACALEAGWSRNSAEIRAAALRTMTLVSRSVLTKGCYAEHQAALAANPELGRPLASCLLRRCLPAVAATAVAAASLQADTEELEWLTEALSAPCMAAAVGSYLRHPAEAAAAVRQAARVVEQLPLAQPGSIDKWLVRAYSSATSLLTLPCFDLLGLPLYAGGADAAGGGSAPASSSTGSTGGCSSGGSGGDGEDASSSGDSGEPSDSAGGGSDSPGSVDSSVPHRKAACKALLGALPKLVALIAAAAADGSPLLQPAGSCSGREAGGHAEMQHNLAFVAASLSQAMALPSSLADTMTTLPDFHRWIDAADAAVRLQPSLARLHAAPGLSGGSPSLAGEARFLARTLVWGMWGQPPPLMVPLGAVNALVAAQRASLGSRMWQLHSISTRWIHSQLAAEQQEGGQAGAYWGQSGGRQWGMLLFALNAIFLRAQEAMCGCADVAPGPTAAAQQAALCVGHWEAVQALAAAAAPGGGLTLSNTDEFTVLLKTYNCMANTCPWLATPSFYEPLRQALLRAQCGGTPAPMPSVTEALFAAANHPRVAASAVLCGLVATAAGAAAIAAMAMTNLSDGQVSRTSELLTQVERTLLCLEQGAFEACCSLTGSSGGANTVGSGGDSSSGNSTGGSGGNSDGTNNRSGSSSGGAQPGDGGEAGTEAAVAFGPPSLAQALHASACHARLIREVLERRHAAQRSPPSLVDRANAVEQRFPVCYGAARLLDIYFGMAEQAAAARLEAAQAAAARSCAYLACTNMACTGGPGVRQGEGSSRCSACRAVCYCGTACSHADWRAGHRRVCKALGAARQQQRQQGSKPRRTADAGAEEHCWPGSGFALFGLKM